jgi:hypothetical protein
MSSQKQGSSLAGIRNRAKKQIKMKEECEVSSLLPNFGSCKAGTLLLDWRSVDATPSRVRMVTSNKLKSKVK